MLQFICKLAKKGFRVFVFDNIRELGETMNISSIRAQEVNKKNQPTFKMKFIDPLGLSASDKLNDYLQRRLVYSHILDGWAKMDELLPCKDYFLHADDENNLLILKKIKNLDLFRPNDTNPEEMVVLSHPFNFKEPDYKNWTHNFIKIVNKIAKAERLNQKAIGLSEQSGVKVFTRLNGTTDFADDTTEKALEVAVQTLEKPELKDKFAMLITRNRIISPIEDHRLAFELYSNTPKPQYIGKATLDPKQKFDPQSFSNQISSIPLPY